MRKKIKVQENSSIQCLESKKSKKDKTMQNPQYSKSKRYNGKRIQTIISKDTYEKFQKKANQANISESAFLELIIEFNNSEQIDLFLELNKYKKINERLKNELVCLIENIQKIKKKNKRILNGKYC